MLASSRMFCTSHSGKTLSLILALLVSPQISWAEVDAAVVAKILGEELSRPPEIDTEKSKRMLDSMSDSATKALDQNNKDWNATSPKWQAIHDRIRADLESEMPSIRAAVKDQGQKSLSAFEMDIAAHLSQSDVDAFLAYYRAPEGQRYQEFMRRVDKIMLSGVTSLASPGVRDTGQQSPAELTPEQTERYTRMLMLSRPYQSTVALSQNQHDPSGSSGVMGFGMAMAVRKDQQGLEALSREYAADLNNFEAFTKSDAAQHFFAAMAHAMPLLTQGNSIANSIKAVERKHEDEWKALYLAQ